MTPKEKAEELVQKYIDIRWDITKEDAKQCALIAVDEIIQTEDYFTSYNNIDGYTPFEYWQEVKKEIQNI